MMKENKNSSHEIGDDELDNVSGGALLKPIVPVPDDEVDDGSDKPGSGSGGNTACSIPVT